MLNIKTLQDSGYFKKRTLKHGEYLFKEGEYDENIYIILSGELSIEKYTDNKKDEIKTLAILKENEVFGEASLNNNLAKQVSIKAKKTTNIIYINAVEGLDNFSKKYNKEAFNLLKYIIFLSNNRLNISNKLITSSYKISNEIIKLRDFKYKTIFNLIDNIQEITDVKQIIFLEENPVMKEYLVIKYKTDKKGLMQDEIIKVTDNKLELLDLKTSGKYNYTQNLKIGYKNYGYLIFIRENKDFNENEIKVFGTISTSLAGVLKQKEYLEEQANKEYMKNN